ARNAHGEGGWLKELSVPRVGTVGYFCSASLTNVALIPQKSVNNKKAKPNQWLRFTCLLF
ncbi:hypothetical protein, partial [Pseudomonas syringae]|uniref:hypothetical protein n=1 Tax=Pseudomonas syringae TaxID=317 RepID=UPI001FF83E51